LIVGVLSRQTAASFAKVATAACEDTFPAIDIVFPAEAGDQRRLLCHATCGTWTYGTL